MSFQTHKTFVQLQNTNEDIFDKCLLIIYSESGNISVTLLSMQGQKALRFHQTFLNLFSEDD